jgi:TolA-binding protein
MKTTPYQQELLQLQKQINDLNKRESNNNYSIVNQLNDLNKRLESIETNLKLIGGVLISNGDDK